MLKIVVMRHGKPELDLEELKSDKMASINLGSLVNEYEFSGLDKSHAPDECAIKISETCAVSLSSDLPRATSSIELLGLSDINDADACFRESALPYLEWHRPKLTFFTWAMIFRIAWFIGFSNNGESIKQAKKRAVSGVDKLERIVRTERSVLFMGHGIMNRLIISELKRRQWSVKEKTPERYWSYTVLEYGL